ncbi:putative Vegetative incompatibility protein HET-E-1 [Seiridium unicorne]|uniref:Vegetative incompatibility protein HET-E-1 n=1 Tax=Seiridium unicorne TaxID=138068 RepID=A0ABR2UFP3_9PEZI
MRLLKIEDDGSLGFTKDLVRGIPPYAILSHTWGDDDQEIQYQDIIQGIGKEKEGYRKIEFCRKQAAIHGLQHFWVDTCCINKTNFTELSEAINSMFRWYQNATRCYVYLSDVSFWGDDGAAEEELRRPTWKSDLRKSRWFTRGWTLQELVAPEHVEFFAAKGQIAQRLGDKKGLHQLLCDMTGIPTGAFRRGLMSEFTIEERMSWIKGRATTKPEDLAYCLFGIFDVQLPILYGEGQTKALERLRKEVDVQSPVTEALNKLPVVEGAAFDSHAQEHETTCLEDTRVDLLREISQWVQNPRGKNVFWLNGMAGTGKSTISRTIAQFGAADNQLGASYFFKRGENDRSSVAKLFSTIAAQMVSKRPAMASYVLEVLNSESMVLQKPMQKQLGSLILDPLSKLAKATGMDGAIPIVIDALDECEREDDVKVLIKLFCELQQPQPFRLKFLVTSRPDLPIRLGFQAVEGNYQDLILHEIYEPIIEHDIRVYIRHQLRHIKECYDKSVPEPRRLPSAWPTESDTETLVHMAVPLFIFAATSCRFIADRRIGNPEEQLIEILTYKTKSQESQLDGTYFPVLNQMVRGLLGK